MTSYRKSGQSVRIERRGGAMALMMTTTESGGFADRDGRIEVRSGLPLLPGLPASPEMQRAVVDALVAAFDSVSAYGIIEQLVITSGVAVHQYDDRTWQESMTQVVATIADRPRGVRYTLLRGGVVDAGEVARSLGDLLGTMARPDQQFSEVTPVTLAPAVAAELMRLLFHASVASVSFHQQAPHFSTRDGVGRLIESRQLSSAAPSTTIYRPTYRVAPVRHALHLRAEFTEAPNASPLRLVQLSQPPRVRDGSIELTGLMTDDEGASVQQLRIPFDAVGSIVRSPGEAAWFPIAGGTWGDSLTIGSVQPAMSSRA